MLSIGKLAAGPDAGRYYVEQVAQGREDYYGGEGEAPGRWTGTGSARLALSGVVEDGQLLQLLAGQRPGSGEDFGRPVKSGDVAGFDLTFRAPKSVSILFGIGDEELSAQIRDGHEAAVTEALGYLEREACVVRRGKGGAVQLPGDGFVAAAFRHRASRAGDPLLHTHVVVANTARGPDGRWTALFGRRLYAEAKTAGYLYQSVLRAELTERIGLDWEPVSNGTADLRGVPRDLIERFSTRRHEVLAALESRGEHSARAAQVATLDTRRTKTISPVADQRHEWRLTARAHGVEVRSIDDAREPSRPGERAPLPPDDVRDHLLGDHGLTEHRACFDRGAALQALADASPQGDRVSDLEERADALLADPRVVQLADGQWSTRELIDLEHEVLRGAHARRAEPPVRPDPLAVQRAAAERALSEEQCRMVKQLVLGEGGVQVVRAPAGAGKTYALDAARAAWQEADVAVLGCALSARAACELREQTAMDATTIARLRFALEEGCALQSGSVLIVDEAGMVGTRDLAALTRATGAAGARLILVGDDHQLPEIAAGGAFAELAREGPTIELREVRRQHHAWDRGALSALRDGDLEAFVDGYARHGRLKALPNAVAARECLVEDWWQATQDGQDALMLAHRRADVADLNAGARERMREAGRLGDDVLDCGERSFAVGDRVIAMRNDRHLRVHNGQAGRVTDLGDGRLRIATSAGDELELPFGYAQEGHLDHGYALTAHRAQGSTVDATFVLGSDGLSREWGYTAMSRHRDQAQFYISARPAFLNAPTEPLSQPADITSAVADALRSSRMQALASARLEQERADHSEISARRVEEATQRLEWAREERAATNIFRRGARAKLDARIEGFETHLERAEQDLAERHEDKARCERLPHLSTGRDPLAGIDPPDHGLHRDLAPPDLDTGLDLGW